MKPIRKFTPMLAITLLLALTACRPDELADYSPNLNPGATPGTPYSLTLDASTARPQFEEDGAPDATPTRALTALEKSAWTVGDRIYFRLQLLGGADADRDGLPDTPYSPWDGQELTAENVTTQLFTKSGVTTVTAGKENPNGSVSGDGGAHRHYLVGIAQYNGSAWSITSLKAIAIYAGGTYAGQLVAFKSLNAGSLVLPVAATALVGTAQYAPTMAPHQYPVETTDGSAASGGPLATGIPVWQSTCILPLDDATSGSLPLAFRTWTPLCARLRINTLPGLKLDFQSSRFSLYGGQPLEYTTNSDGSGAPTDNLLSYDPATGLPALGNFGSFDPDAAKIKSLTPDATTGDLIFYVPLATDATAGSTPAPTLTLHASGAVETAPDGTSYSFTNDQLKIAGLIPADASARVEPIFKVSELKLAQPKDYKVDAATAPANKLAALADGILPSVTDADGTTYLLYNETALRKFAHIVMGTAADGTSVGDGSGDDAHLDACARLMADIHLTAPATEGESNWTPLGNYTDKDNKHPYTGTFDGQWHTVSGIVINRPATNGQGFFGYIDKGSKPISVKNLTVDGTVTGKQYAGGVVGYSNNATITITNCTNMISVTGESYVGGIVGKNNNATIIACTNKGSVKGGTALFSYIGGITGYNKSTTITACINTGSVESTGTLTERNSAGGITGHNESTTITACINTGSVKGTSIAGGVAGENIGNATITACINTGSVENTSNSAGGVTGNNNSSTITTCYWQTFGTGNRPEKGVGTTGSSSTAAISSAYSPTGSTTPAWFAPGTTPTDRPTTATPAAALNAAIEKWNANNQAKLCPYRYVENPAYPAALSAAGAPDYDTNVPPLLLKQVPAD